MINIPNHRSLAASGTAILDLGLQPVSNRFIRPGSNQSAPRYPLELRLEEDSGLLHLGQPFPVEEVRPIYDWITCYEPEDHLDDVVEELCRLPGLSPESQIGGYSFKDDSTLDRLRRRGYERTWRINPGEDLGVQNPLASVESFQAVFTPEVAQTIKQKYGGADLFIVRHVIEHAYDLPVFIEALRALLNPGGHIFFELPDCQRAIEAGDCTTLWEEHVYYFTRFTFRSLLESLGFGILHYHSAHYPLEDSLIAIATDSGLPAPPADLVQVKEENERARAFSAKIELRSKQIQDTLRKLAEGGTTIAMFGAGHLSIAFLSIVGVAEFVAFIVDDNPHKNGLRLPVGDLPILGSRALYERKVDLCLLSLNPQNQGRIIAKHERFVQAGGKFASIFPGSELDLLSVL